MSELLERLLAITPEELEAMPPEDQQWVLQTLEFEQPLASPAAFAVAHSKRSDGTSDWQPYRHAKYISDRIVAGIERDEWDCLIVDTAIRVGKSQLCSKWTPAWFIAKYHGWVGLASYEGDFAATWGHQTREIIKEHGGKYDCRIDDSSRAKQRWNLSNHDGGMFCAGAGGAIIGKGGNLMIVDDPIKNAEEASSAVQREALWEWWQQVFLGRREPWRGKMAKVIVIMSRWHVDDLVARILQNTEDSQGRAMRIERLRLPAIAEEDDLLGRRPGEALCPERFDEVAYAGIRADVGARAWASQYQQRPVPAGGGLFKETSFRYYTASVADGKTYYQLGETTVAAEHCWRFSTFDPAFVKGKRSDYTVVATWDVTPTDPSRLVLVDLRRVRLDQGSHVELLGGVWAQLKPSWVGIEKQNATLSTWFELQRKGVVIRWLIAEKNKVARAETAAAIGEAGRLWLPKNAEWLGDYLDEMLSFSPAMAHAHDDQVDVTSYACIQLAQRTVRARAPKEEPSSLDEKCWAQLERKKKKSRVHPVLGRM